LGQYWWANFYLIGLITLFAVLPAIESAELVQIATSIVMVNLDASMRVSSNTRHCSRKSWV